MSDVPFYRTQMGHRFYEHTVPELVRQIGRVADLLERIAPRVASADDDPAAIARANAALGHRPL